MKTAVLTLIALTSLVLATSSSDFQQSKKPYVPSGNEGAITGKISFSGEAHAPRHIDMAQDLVCINSHLDPVTEDVVITDGMVANVLVYVKSKDLDTFEFEPPSTPVTLERKGCQLIPHVLGIQTHQTLQVLSNSMTAHNTHALPRANPEWNFSQPLGSPPVEKTFDFPEQVISNMRLQLIQPSPILLIT